MSFNITTESGDHLICENDDHLIYRYDVFNIATKQVKWLFDIDLAADGDVDYRWSTKTSSGYTPKILSFTPLTIDLGSVDEGILSKGKITVAASFPNGVIDGHYADNFVGAGVTVRLVIADVADVDIVEVFAFRFKVIDAYDIDQQLFLECEDFFSAYLEGDYPNKKSVSELFPATVMKSDNYCVPVIFGTPYFPCRWITKNTTATYVDADTFTVLGNKTGLFSTGQYLIASCGADGIKRGWVLSSSYSSVTTVNLTTESDDLTSNLTSVQTNHYLLASGSPTCSIVAMSTPSAVPYTQEYLPAAYTFKQDTITGSDGSEYQVVQAFINDSDGDGDYDANGYFPDGSAVHDTPIKFSSNSSALTNPVEVATFILEAWGISFDEIDEDSYYVAEDIFDTRGLEFNLALWFPQAREKLLAKLFSLAGMVPRIRDKVGFKVLTKVSQLTLTENMVKPGSFTINSAYTQKEKDSGYVTWQTADKPVDRVNKTLVAVKSTTAKPSDTTIEAEWIQSAVNSQKAGKLALQRILLRDKTITFVAKSIFLLLEPGDVISINPVNFGGVGGAYDCVITKMTVQEDLWIDVECTKFSDTLDDWEDLGDLPISLIDANTEKGITPIYQGSTAGGVDGTDPTVINQSVFVTGNIQIQNGGDLILNGSDTDPGVLILNGTNFYSTLGTNTSGTKVGIHPSSSENVDLLLGYNSMGIGDGFQNIKTLSQTSFETYVYYSEYDFIISTADASIGLVSFNITADGVGGVYLFTKDCLYPGEHKIIDLGLESQAWDEAWGDEWHNVADFLYLDHRKDAVGDTIPVDDIATIKAIRPSGVFDPRTGLELIDDNTLPEWLLSKNKKSGEVARGPDGKPYLALKVVDSLLMGAVRQLSEQIEELKAEITKLKAAKERAPGVKSNE